MSSYLYQVNILAMENYKLARLKVADSNHEKR